jgi:hypothetical protein
MKKGLIALAVAAGVVALWFFWPAGGFGGAKITQRARQAAPADAEALSLKLIPGDDLPPPGTRSLFDHLIAQADGLPYPFEKLVETIQRQDPANKPPLTLMIPHGRSLLKAMADYQRPRVVLAADFQAPDTAANLGLTPRGQLFLGFVENANEIEVLSYNEAAGRFEFQLVQDYCEGCIPKLVYAKRAICTTCHQGGGPIFPQRPWNETNGQPETAAKIAEARFAAGFNRERYLGLPVANPLSVPERFDELTDIGNFLPTVQRTWIDGCGDGANGAACRRLGLKLALAYVLNPAGFDDKNADANQLRDLQSTAWPQAGIAVSGNDLFNRDPLGEARGVRGYLRTWFASKPKPGAGARNNEDLEAFDRLPKLPADLDPLTPRLPKRVLKAADLDGVYSIAALLTDSDVKALEGRAGHVRANLLAGVDALPESFFAPAPFSRVRTLQALLGGPIKDTRKNAKPATAPGYCCLDTAEMSAPVASGEPRVEISEGSELKHFEQFCFACHRGNPSKKLDFMSGRTEAEVLAHIKEKAEIRDALDWARYRGTDKENKMMPPASSVQRRQLEKALGDNPKLLEEMRAAVPGLFDF